MKPTRTRKFWTAEDLKYLKDHYADTPTPELAKHLGRTIHSLYAQTLIHGLKKSEAFLKSPLSGRMVKGHSFTNAGTFKKGQVPVNKGKKMSPELYEKVKHSFFKKGNEPANTRADNEISYRKKKGDKFGYLYIRKGKSDWVLLHRKIWEEANGPIPEKHCLVFIDGNTANCQLENLKLMTKRENRLRNNVYNYYPEEVKNAIYALSGLKHRITTITKNQNKKQNEQKQQNQ
jgi:hypothetical protein